jgi:small-conductance mechanosensitive channel
MALLFCGLAIPCAAQGPMGLLLGEKPKAKRAAAAPVQQSQPAQPQPVTPQIIPLPEVADRAEELSQTLNMLSDSLPTRDQLNDMNASIADQRATLEGKRKESEALLHTAVSPMELREQENYWRGVKTFGTARRKQLLDWANAAQSAIDQLDQMEPSWAATLENYKDQRELQPLLELIRQNLADTRKLRDDARDELQLIVRMQIATGVQDQWAADMLSRLITAQDTYKDRLLRRDSLPFWQISLRHQQGENKEVFSSANRRWITIATFLSQRKGTLAFLLLVLVLSTGVAFRLNVLTRNAHSEEWQHEEALLIVRRWVALGLLAPLLLGYLLSPSAPLSLIGLAILLSFIPILRLLAPLLQARERSMLYCLAAYYGLNMLISWLGFRPVVRRELVFVLTLALFLTFAYFLRPTWVRSLKETGSGHPLLLFAARVAVFALGCSLLANLLGYVRLAQYFGLATIYSAFIGISLYTGSRVYTTLLQAGLTLPQAEHLAVVRLHRDALLRWVPRLFNWTAAAIWLSATLDLFRVRDSVTDGIADVLNFHIAGTASDVTLGRVLGFFLMLAIGYCVANTVRFLLREELLSRFHLSRGLPDLIAFTVYYLLLLFVFLVAVNAGGIELNKFTLLTGALGVGFGFGMQNIINNFVSGLILQFERPIHIGDVLEVEGYTGTVTHIGIRSSTLKTFQGAEVIIPNGNMISGKVINWTLSESKRRGELPIGVAYGTDPNIVLKILLDAANKHESVLTDPQPAAYFKGFGESSLDFELQFWVMQDSNWVRVRSDIAMTVMKRLEEAGIEIPFPQRDLHLRSVDEAAAVQGSADAVKPEPVRRKTVGAEGN